MARPGGEADKLGNFYEGLWTVDAILDLLEGDFTEIVVEAVGDEGSGVEFVRTRSAGGTEYHSIKRQESRGNWTLSRLTQQDRATGRSILGDLVAKLAEGSEVVFSSGTSASELEAIREHANHSETVDIFHKRLGSNGPLSERFQTYLVPVFGTLDRAYEGLRHLTIRTKNESVLTKDVELRIRTSFRLEGGGALDPHVVRLLIADFVTNHLGERLTGDYVLASLAEHGIGRTRILGDQTVGNELRRWNRRYLDEVQSLLINGAEITRSESTEALRAILDEGKSVMIEAAAGGGKTCVMAQIVERLNSEDVPCLTIRLDRLIDSDQSARGVGLARGLPDSPVITLGEFAGKRPSVLCIDQLDALSLVSGRNQGGWSILNEMLDETRAYPEMRVLFACRAFDLEHDARLRGLAKDEERVIRLVVAHLDEETVRSAVARAGLSAQLNTEQMRLLSIPLHLYLFLEVSGAGPAPNFLAAADLMDAYWNRKAAAVDQRTLRQGSFSDAIDALSRTLSEHQSLSAATYVLDQHQAARDALASEGVISLQSGQLRFFHETFFDYAFARTFVRSGQDLAEWLRRDEQPLFRRSQVRQILTFLRDREPQRRRYLATLAELLEGQGIRFHIRKLLLDWLRGLEGPTADEWLIVERNLSHIGDHAWSVVANSVAWFDVLQELGRWDQWLASNDEQINRAMHLLQMPDVLVARSDVVVGLVSRFRGVSEEWHNRLRYLFWRGPVHGNPVIEDFFLSLIEDGTLDDYRPGIAQNSDFWSGLYSTSNAAPTFTVRIIAAWFDRQVQRAEDAGHEAPFEDSVAGPSFSQGSERAIERSASGAPEEFCRELLPRFANIEARSPLKWTPAPGMRGGPDDQLREALAVALTGLAAASSDALDEIVAPTIPVATKWMAALLLRAWSANPRRYGEQIVRFVLASPTERLTLGYDWSMGEVDSFVAISRTALAAASSVCSDESLERLEAAILSLAPDWEKKARLRGRTRLALLRALPAVRLSPRATREIGELERRFPEATERGSPEPPSRQDILQPVGSPIPEHAHSRMTDDQWLAAMREYTNDWSTVRGGRIVGGSIELSRGLSGQVRSDPARFAALTDRMDASIRPIYFEAILSGLTSVEGAARRAGTLMQVAAVLRRTTELQVPVHGTAIARAIRAVAEEDIPDDLIGLICRVAREDPDPERDEWLNSNGYRDPINQAINTARGTAAEALSYMLYADRGRWSVLRPTVAQLVVDPVLAVRSTAVECLLAVLDTHRDDALLLFTQLAHGADPILSTHHVERFVHFAMLRDYSVARPILMTMLESSSADSVRTAAGQITLAGLWNEDAREDAGLLLNSTEYARTGAATVYAANVASKTVGAECAARLLTLFEDEAPSVRTAAAGCWQAMAPDEVARHAALIETYARSAAFEAGVSTLLYKLEDATVPLPQEMCTVAEQAVEAWGVKASAVQFGEAGDAHILSKLMIRLHEEAADPAVRTRVLDAIDGMMEAGFYGLDGELRGFER